MQTKSPLRYFILDSGLAVPFWLVGGRQLPPPVGLPASAPGTFVMMTAAGKRPGGRVDRVLQPHISRQSVIFESIPDYIICG